MSSTVLPSLRNQSNLLIVCSNGLVFKCDMCNSTIKDSICFCNKCRKCLHLTCAGVEIKSEYINRHGKKQTVLPAPEDLPKNCRDCMRSITTIVGNNNAIRPRRITESATIERERSRRPIATVDSHNSIRPRRITESATIERERSRRPIATVDSHNSIRPRRITESATGDRERSRRPIVDSHNSIRPRRITESETSDRETSRRSIDDSNNSIRRITDHQESSTKVSLSSIYRFLESTNQTAHKLVECMYDDECLIHRSMPGHELEKKHYGTVYRCFGCKEKGFGPHHACRNASCSFHLHEDCKSPRKFMMHPFFPGSSFTFSSSPKIKYCKNCEKDHSTVNCNACGMDVNGYFYQSHDGRKHLHPCCANLPRQITCGESGVTMVLQRNTTSSCFYCNEATVMVDKKKTDQIWSYVSQCKTVHLHVSCMIKKLSDFKVIGSMSSRAIGSTSLLTLHKKTEVNYSMTKLEFQITAAADAKKKWEREFKTIMKYAKIVFGAIISACLGNPVPLIFHCIVAFIS